jgi:hypothetical protein
MHNSSWLSYLIDSVFVPLIGTTGSLSGDFCGQQSSVKSPSEVGYPSGDSLPSCGEARVLPYDIPKHKAW